MFYRSLHITKERWKLAILGVLIGAFFVAMALMWVHPAVSMLILWAGLIILGVGALVSKLIGFAEHAAARNALRSHLCPKCGAEILPDPKAEGTWHCYTCGAAFVSAGEEQLPDAIAR